MTIANPTATRMPTQEEQQQEYYSALESHRVAPLWGVLHKMVPPRPNPASQVQTWPYANIRPLLMHAGEVISAEEAERRVLMLVNNSALGPPYSTDTIYAGMQLILPGETAPAHRHTAFALRFIVEGESDGAFTAVEGKKVVMERGDVILTPSWTWHDHGSDGNGPMVWLDGLDLPVYRFLPVNFAENYREPRYPSDLVDGEHAKDIKFPWKAMQDKLDANASKSGHAKFAYRHSDGSHLSKTISAQAERVNAGTTSDKIRETLSFVYHIYEGDGYTTISTPGGEKKVVEWTGKDTFSVPAWSTVSHTCTLTRGAAYLFAINDRPIIEALGLYRKEES